MDEELYERYKRLRDQGLTHEEASSRLGREPSVARDVASQLGRGALEAGTSLVGGLGWLGEKAGGLIPGEDPVERAGRSAQEFARSSEERLARALPAETAAGTAARFAGRLGGEVATTLGTLGASRAASLRYAPRIAEAASKFAGGSRLRSALTTAAAEAPLTGVQAAAEASRGGDLGTALAVEALGSFGGGLLAPPLGAVRRTAEGAEPASERFAREYLKQPARETEVAPQIRRAVPEEEEIVPGDYINIARMTDDEEVQALIEEAARRVVRETDVPLRYGPDDAPSLQGTLREPEPFTKVEADARRILAQDLGIDPADIVERTAKGERIGRAELLAVRSAFSGLLQEGDRIYREIASGGLSPEDLRVAELQLDRLKNTQDALMNSFMKQRTEIARDLSALRISALDNPDPITAIARITDLAKRPLTQVEREAIRKAVNEGDTEALRKIADGARTSTTGEKLSTFFKAGLLTQPKTHLANVFGNITMQGLESAKELPAYIFDKMLSAQLARRTNQAASEYWTKDFDPIELARSSTQGAVRGIEEARAARRGDPSQLQDITRWDRGRETNYDSPLLNFYTKGVFRWLDAEDRFFRGVSFQRSLEEQARVLARSEGLSGAARGARARELIDTPTDEMVARAIGDSEYAVFQDNSELAKAAISARGMFGPLGQYLFPFAKTPANIADRIIDYSPAGMLSVLNDTRKLLKDPANRALHKKIVENAGRSSVGTTAMLIGGLLASEGKMTGLYPTDRKTQDQWRATGKQEGSLLLPNGQYYNLTRISPLGNLMAIGSTMYDIYEDTDKDANQKLIGIALTPLSAITDLPMASGTRDAINAVTGLSEGSGEAAARLAGRTAQGFIPFSGLARGTAYGLDPYVRETRGQTALESVGRQAASQIPGLSEMLPPRVDPLGQIVERGETVLSGISDPFTSKPRLADRDPVRAEMERINTSVPRLNQEEGESDEDFVRRSQITGQTTQRALQALIANPAYQDIANIDTGALRQIATQFGVDLENVSDEQIAQRVQRFIFETVSGQVRGAVKRGLFPTPTGGQAGALLRELGQYK